MRAPARLLCLSLLLLAGCPWIAEHNPDVIDTDPGVDTADTGCDGAWCEDACDEDSEVAGELDGSGSFAGSVCGGMDEVRLAVEAGCVYDLSVQSVPGVTVSVYEEYDELAETETSLDLSATAAFTGTWFVRLWGEFNDEAYSVRAAEDCPDCTTGSRVTGWNTVLTSRLCPSATSLTVRVSGGRVNCDQTLNLHTSDRTTTTLVITDSTSTTTSLSDDSGLMAIAGALVSADGDLRVDISQPWDAEVEQGVWLELVQDCP